MATPQKALQSQTKSGQGEETSGVTTPSSPDQQNIHKSTWDNYKEDIINITKSDKDEKEDDNKSISLPTSYSADMHMSGDNIDGQDCLNLIDTNEDNNNETMNNQESCGFLSAPMGLAVSPACWSAQHNSN